MIKDREEFEKFYQVYVKNLTEEEKFSLIDGMNMLLWHLSELANVPLFEIIELQRVILLDDKKHMMDSVRKLLKLPIKFKELMKEKN